MKKMYPLLSEFLTFFTILQLVLAQNQQGFISLDCGLSDNEPPYTESKTGLTFSSDSGYVKGGKTGRIQKHLEADVLKPYVNLRYFPSGSRNCYNIKVTKGTRYLIRAAFLYGNYDGQDNFPVFDLYIGWTWWATIFSLKESKDALTSLQLQRKSKFEEIIHIPKSNTLQVCLVQTNKTATPFISALELRPLSNHVYATQKGSLKKFFRGYFSYADTSIIRYPDDVYDRTWAPFTTSNFRILNNTVITNTTSPYDPPVAAVMTAVIPLLANIRLSFYWLPIKPKDKFYVYLHIHELQVLSSNESRIFDIVLNNSTTSSDYRPTKSMIDTVSNKNPLNCSDLGCTLNLIQTLDSNLPPLLNAFEVYSVLEFPESETDVNDVIAFEDIKDMYGLNNVSEDPCFPKPSNYLKCTNNTPDTSDEPLRIISLNLSSIGLSGYLLTSIQNLTKLQVLDLSSNNLTGGVPEFLSKTESLLFIDLRNNDLSGLVPRALLDRRKEGLILKLEGNPKLVAFTSDNKKFPVAVVASVSSIAFILILLTLLFVYIRRKPSSEQAERPLIETAKRKFSFSEVKAMTNNFHKILGEGGFGIIYHGKFNDTQQVAVKVLSKSSSQGYKQFKAEVELLLRVHHINLVSLVGYCDERENLALVYEYMANKDLKEHLSGNEDRSFLDWSSRLRIASEAALGLEYLHIGCKPPMIHRDVKSTNILLNEDFKAKIGDFGLSRSFPVDNETHVSTGVVGTPGFLDPEYYQTQWLTEKSDVYSFGIALLEIITNQSVIDQTREKPHIAEWVRFKLTTGDIESIMDPNLKGNYDSGSAWKVLELAMSCSKPFSVERPNMTRVVHELNECILYENSTRGRSQDMNLKNSIKVNPDTDMSPLAR